MYPLTFEIDFKKIKMMKNKAFGCVTCQTFDL